MVSNFVVGNLQFITSNQVDCLVVITLVVYFPFGTKKTSHWLRKVQLNKVPIFCFKNIPQSTF